MSIFQAKWITGKPGDDSPIFRKHFSAEKVSHAVLDICGLGWFVLYINGKAVGNEFHKPAVSTYEQINGRRLSYPLQDVFNSPRIYYCRYDISSYLIPGDNVMAVMLGNGWYNQKKITAEGNMAYGPVRLCFSLDLLDDIGHTWIESDESTLVHPGFICDNNLYLGETQMLKDSEYYFLPQADDSEWSDAVQIESPKGELTLQTCPPDCVIRTITPRHLYTKNGRSVYDVGENISGFVQFSTSSRRKITVCYAEELYGGKLSFDSIGGHDRKSEDVFYGDGKRHCDVHPYFTWHGFRYFTIRGQVQDVSVHVVHTQMKKTSDFESDSLVLNWLYEAFVRTQLSNTHACVPSDCPHRERLGYTGDGQVCCDSVMSLFDARAMYEKWMQDIVDCQGENGHVQHTAPFYGGGGGPCGWGGAVVVVPYFYYLHYGEVSFIAKYYDNMKRWFDYVESRCEDGLVVREEKGGWCLGDWCVPDIEQTDFPADYVNTCLLVKFYGYYVTLSKALGKNVKKQITLLIDMHKKALTEKYFDSESGSFLGGKYGADAFALDIGLGNEKTLDNLKRHYRSKPYFDTGIFGTDIVLRVLFENGADDIALALMMNESREHSFGYMMKMGATTLWENWNAASSHSHPMFGGCTRLLMQYVLGIRPTAPGFETFVVSPTASPLLNIFSGHMHTKSGDIAVFVHTAKGKRTVRVKVEGNGKGIFRYGGKETALHEGMNEFEVESEENRQSV